MEGESRDTLLGNIQKLLMGQRHSDKGHGKGIGIKCLF